MSTTTASREASRARHPASRVGPPSGRRSTAFVVLLGTVGVLTLLGTVMVLSASSVSDLRLHGSAWYSFKRQLVYMGVGGVALVVALRTGYHAWRRLAMPLLVFSNGLLLAVLVSPFGVSANGSTRWLAFGGIQVQPAELTKLAVVLFCADLLSRPERDIRDTRATLNPVMLMLGAIGLLLMAQPDLGTLIVIAVTVFVVLYVAGTPLVPLGLLGSLGLATTLALSMHESYRRARLTAFMDPWADPLNSGYQSIQSLVGIASGGVTGVGLGASRAKWGFLPYAHTDFIFAVIAEELGLIGAALVIGLFVTLAAAGTRVAIGAPDRLGLLLAAGITVWFVGQAVVNIGAAVSALPVTGVPLPFVSFGGTALVVNLFATGILLNVARHSR